MNLAVSNIAWAPHDRLAAYALLGENGIGGLEIAPGLFLDGAEDPFVPDATTLARVRAETADAGLRLVSMQSLLYGVEGAALFGPTEARDRFCSGMLRAIGLAETLGIPNLVFGSPKQRVIPDHMSAQEAHDRAVTIFGALGDAAAAAGTRIAIEANPAAYGTNFLTDAEAATGFVRALGHPAVTVNFDVGAMHMNDAFRHVDRLIPDTADLIGHVHVSEPFLAPAPARHADARHLLSVLHAAGYSGWVSLEMAAPEGGLDTLGIHVARLAAAARDAEARG